MAGVKIRRTVVGKVENGTEGWGCQSIVFGAGEVVVRHVE